MTDRLPFLAAIAADPDNVAARLVHADWLEERGGEDALHAELIRVQCELAVWRADESARSLSGEGINRHAELRRREGELVALLLPGLKFYGVCTRGFFTSLTMNSDECRREAAAICERHPVTSLRLTDWLSIDRSLPDNPREALPFLKRLELPLGHAFWEQRAQVLHEVRDELFGHNADGKPRVEVAFWDDRPPVETREYHFEFEGDVVYGAVQQMRFQPPPGVECAVTRVTFEPRQSRGTARVSRVGRPLGRERRTTEEIACLGADAGERATAPLASWAYLTVADSLTLTIEPAQRATVRLVVATRPLA